MSDFVISIVQYSRLYEISCTIPTAVRLHVLHVDNGLISPLRPTCRCSRWLCTFPSIYWQKWGFTETRNSSLALGPERWHQSHGLVGAYRISSVHLPWSSNTNTNPHTGYCMWSSRLSCAGETFSSKSQDTVGEGFKKRYAAVCRARIDQ
jgi:hypothetical protein